MRGKTGMILLLLPAVVLILGLVLTLSSGSIVRVEPDDNPPVPADGAVFSGQNAYDLLKDLVQRYPYRVTGTDVYHDAALWAMEQFEAAGLEVELERFFSPVVYRYESELPLVFLRSTRFFSEETEGWNVAARLAGDSPETILVTAHLDIVPETVQGAADDGSGVATVLELARALQARPLRHSFVFVLCDREEPGLFGSRAFATAHPEMDIVQVLNLDNVGARTDDLLVFQQPTTRHGATPPGTVALLEACAKQQRYAFWMSESMFDLPFPLDALLNRAANNGNLDSTSFYRVADSSVTLLTWPSRGSLFTNHTRADTVDAFSPIGLKRAGTVALDFLLAVDERPIGTQEQENGGLYRILSNDDGTRQAGYLRSGTVNLAVGICVAACLLSIGCLLFLCRKSFRLARRWIRSGGAGFTLRVFLPALLAVLLPLAGFFPLAVWFTLTAWPVFLPWKSRDGDAEADGDDGPGLVIGGLSAAVFLTLLALLSNVSLSLVFALPVFLIWLPVRYWCVGQKRATAVIGAVLAVIVLVAGLFFAVWSFNEYGFRYLTVLVAVFAATAGSIRTASGAGAARPVKSV